MTENTERFYEDNNWDNRQLREKYYQKDVKDICTGSNCCHKKSEKQKKIIKKRGNYNT